MNRAPHPTPEITLYDHDYNEHSTPTKVVKLNATKRCNDVGTGLLATPLNTTAGRRLIECKGDVVPLRIRCGPGFTWNGQATDFELTGPEKSPIITATLEDDYSWLRDLAGWPNATWEWIGVSLPFELQVPPYDIFAGPARNVVAHYVRANASGTPFRAATPVVMLDPPPFLEDRSPLIALASRMTPLSDLFKQALVDAGIVIDVSVWLPGMAQPRGKVLTQPSIVIDTRAARDLRTSVDWRADKGQVLPGYSVQGSGQRVHTLMTGGRSPDALNQLLDQPIAGIDVSFLKNLIAPFNRVTDEAARASHGRFLHPEKMVPGGASAWTGDAAQALAQGWQDNRPKQRATFEVASGLESRTFGTDFQLGDTVSARLYGEWYAEPVDSATLTWEPATGVRITHGIGSDRIDEHPIAKIIRRLKELGDVASSLNLS